MKYFSETYIKDGKLVKSKKHFFICSKCELKLVGPLIESYKYGLCWICFLKSKRFYKSAINEIKIGWFTWTTKWNLNEGWSIWENFMWTRVCIGVLKARSLNKTPKTQKTIYDYYSDYWVKKFGD